MATGLHNIHFKAQVDLAERLVDVSGRRDRHFTSALHRLQRLAIPSLQLINPLAQCGDGTREFDQQPSGAERV